MAYLLRKLEMDFLKMKLDNGGYLYEYACTVKMYVLYKFLSNDIKCNNFIFRRWVFANKFDSSSEFTPIIKGSITFLEEKNDGFIYLCAFLSLEDDNELVEFKLTKEQFVKILDDWEQKVCKLMPTDVSIKYGDNKFIIDTWSEK